MEEMQKVYFSASDGNFLVSSQMLFVRHFAPIFVRETTGILSMFSAATISQRRRQYIVIVTSNTPHRYNLK